MNLPMCAKCHHPVESIHRWDNPRDRSAVFSVRCHGEEETLHLSHALLMDLKRLVMTTAFNGPRKLPTGVMVPP